ncbi:MAG: proprotein convertase P-domain-containing protein [Bacteroidota bacterium]
MLCRSTAFGQEYQMDERLFLVNDCGGFFTDSGGSQGNYGSNENFQTTICKNPQMGTHVRLTFNQFNLADGDRLCFYDGTGTSADSLLCASSFFNGIPFIVQATAANSSGCLTVTFNSKSGSNASGWEANIDCVPACQLVQAQLTDIRPAPQPDARGWVDICEGERVFFEGQGVYPQNGFLYDQSDRTSTFEWDFGDGNFAVGPSVSHVYDRPGGYRVTLTITDAFGCTNSNFAFQRVRVAAKPTFQIGDLPTIACIGDSIQLSGGTKSDTSNSTVEVLTQEGSFLFDGFRSDSLALPDGNGASYETSIRFTDFRAGQTLTNINDLEAICVNMEHSWLHDMEISITCPSGKTVLLQSQQIINKEVYLGIPVDNDGINPKSGIGGNYCWSPTSNKGTITEFSEADNSGNSSDTYVLPSGKYASFEDLEALLGCPLNGDWTITVTDLWEQDNGWIFSWSIDINPDLYPEVEMFEPQIIDFQWQNNPDIVSYSPEVVIARPTKAGTTNYVFEATDNYGCRQDTAIQITVLPNNHPDCLNCEEGLLRQREVTICEGEILNFESFVAPAAIGVKTFEAFPDYTFSNSTHPPNNAYEAVLQVSNVPAKEVETDGANLVSVCLDLTSEYNSDLSISLISPNGVVLNLSSENGGRNDGYLSTCFTMDAATSITEPIEAPFTGNYLPEEPFSKLAGTDINGVWKLKLSDDAGAAATDINALRNWSMTFLSPEGGTFSWSPNDNLSCSDCYDAMGQPSKSGLYILEKNFEGCQVFDTLVVTVLSSDGPLEISDYSLPNGELLVNWEAVTGASGYEVSLNSTDWLPANGDYFHVFEDLTNGTTFNIYVRAIFDNFNCETKFRSRAVRYLFCDVAAELGTHQLTTSCVGSRDASVVIRATGGNTPYSYTLNDGLTGTTNRFSNLAAGDYTVLVQDVGGMCGDTLTFTVTEPDSLRIDFKQKHLDCFGDTNGTTEAIPSGGVGNYEIMEWSHSTATTFEVEDLPSGKYWVRLRDGNNCEIVDTFKITEPTQLQAVASQNSVSCFDLVDGGATVKVTEGTPPYAYDWGDNQTSNSILDLPIGDYIVTVTDAKGCEAIRTVTVTQPDDLTINFTLDSLSCVDKSDASIEVNTVGGIGPYDYEWSNGQRSKLALNLAAEDYTLTVTDSKGCTKTTSINVPNVSAMALSVTTRWPTCADANNASATVSVMGGRAPYAFQWNDESEQTTSVATNLAAGSYKVEVTDDKGCTVSEQVTISAPQPLASTHQITPATCSNRSDGVALIEVTGGDGDYAYQWDNGATSQENRNLAAGSYSVTITDGSNCQLVETLAIEAPQKLSIDSIAVKAPNCNGEATGTLEAFVSGGVKPYNYNWDNTKGSSNPYQNVASGRHVLSMVDANGCITLPQTIELPATPQIELAVDKKDAICYGTKGGQATVSVLGGQGPYSYQWNDEDQQTTATAQNLLAGKYEVLVTDRKDCSTVIETQIGQPNTAIDGNLELQAISCAESSDGQISIHPSGGLPPYTFSRDGVNFDGIQKIVGLSEGNYRVYVKDGNNCVWQSPSITLQSPPPFQVDITAEENIIEFGDSTELSALFSHHNGNIQYSWSATIDSTFDCRDRLCSEIMVHPPAETTYEIYAVDENGCEAADQLTILVTNSRKISIPSGFTPNGDGTNDRLIIHGKEGIKIESFIIFDRWGTTVFESRNLTINDEFSGWDGTFRGKSLNTGVYPWLLNVVYPNGSRETLKGNTTLLR